jgi:hypothetical protein
MEEPSQEDEYFVDCELELAGALLTPNNTLVHLYQPHCWDSVEVELDNGEVIDLLVEEFVIKAMINLGFVCKSHGHPSDGYKEWFIRGAIANLDCEITSFYDEL